MVWATCSLQKSEGRAVKATPRGRGSKRTAKINDGCSVSFRKRKMPSGRWLHMGIPRTACPGAGWGGRRAVGGVWAGEGGDSGTHHPFLLLGLPTPPTAPPSSPLAAANHRPTSHPHSPRKQSGITKVRSVPQGVMFFVGGTLGGRLAPEDVLEHVAGSVVTPPARRGLSCTIYNALHTHSLFPRLLHFLLPLTHLGRLLLYYRFRLHPLDRGGGHSSPL